MSDKYFLAIETSCDETAVAIVRHSKDAILVLGQAVASQIDIHAVIGGVVPEVAAREHVTILPSLLRTVLKESGIKPAQLDAIAVTVGPGLMPALVIGVTAAQTLAYSWKKPIIPIHHLEGHIYSALMSQVNPNTKTQNPTNQRSQPIHEFTIPDQHQTFPALALIVSGGHTMLIQLNHHLQYNVLGTTRDDAAGEAFDKVGQLLNLGYPGGPAVSRAATKGNPAAFAFPRPMIKNNDFNFSFSGLK
ncbi:MAG TPA: tRNA (adenosine(37)-N6)-threonylcarbamoyltransferase complex transferase subunit TsaD, partial [Candidatus Andersenbacteria bacterium]|nr:tRNA (adenosine(37)-N6)-threonylcarbamoyltransferase complex transferase subunit TsaD [Candidatus Andersenbacteria bacterium]